MCARVLALSGSLNSFQVKHVPKERVVAQFEGNWKKSFRWRKVENGAPVGEWRTLIDFGTLAVFPKNVRPVSEQAPFESRRLWEKVTDNLLRKEFGEATRAKVSIEQAQRDRAAELKRKGGECVIHGDKRSVEQHSSRAGSCRRTLKQTWSAGGPN